MTNNAKANAWAVALDVPRSYAADILNPEGEADWTGREDCLAEVVAAVRAQSAPDTSTNPTDRLTHELIIGTDAGYLFGVALACVMQRPWDVLSLWSRVRTDEGGDR